MKAIEQSQTVANRVDVLTGALVIHDGSPLGNLVASHLAQAVGFAYMDLPEDEALIVVEGKLDEAYRVWQQFESTRGR